MGNTVVKSSQMHISCLNKAGKKIKGHLNERFLGGPAVHLWLPKSNFYYEISRYEQWNWGTLIKQGLKKKKKTGRLNERFSPIPAADVWLPK